MTKILLITILIVTSACSGSRTKDTYSTTVYTQEGCDKIFTELDYARRYKKSLHKNDKFMARYLLVIPAIFETYHIVKNENKVSKRIDGLKRQAQINNCYQNNANSSSSFLPYSQNPSMQSGGANSSQNKSQIGRASCRERV